jgi:hypothetical protein
MLLGLDEGGSIESPCLVDVAVSRKFLVALPRTLNPSPLIVSSSISIRIIRLRIGFASQQMKIVGFACSRSGRIVQQWRMTVVVSNLPALV